MKIDANGTEITVIGKENMPKEAALYVGNHRSYFDILILYVQCENLTGFVAKDAIEKVPSLRVWMRYLYCLFLNRSDAREGLKTILTAIEYVKKGISICIFPEGTRSKTGEMASLKAGSFKMATRAKAKVVPVVLKNTRQCLEDAHYFGIVPVYVQILPAIETEDMSPEEMQELPMRVETMLREAYEKLPSFPKKKN